MGTNSFYLFAEPSFFEGMGRVLDLGNTLQNYNESETANEADFLAIKRDWQAVGRDIKISITKYEQEQKAKSPAARAATTKTGRAERK